MSYSEIENKSKIQNSKSKIVMMQVKKYRADTTRAALEQIKQELGEDAFVLETKRVQTRSFFGLKSHPQIEISAASPAPAAQTAEKVTPKSTSILNLTDDAVAVPSAETEETKDIPAILTDALDGLKRVYTRSAAASPKIEVAEISPDAPRIVHQKKESAKPAPVMQQVISEVQAVEPTPASTATFSNRELELLRAELREVKFSLGAINARKITQPRHNEIEADVFFQIFDEPYYEAYVQLTETGISGELARQMISDIIPHYEAGFVQTAQVAQTALQNFLSSAVKFESDLLKGSESNVMAFIGSTGVGKTTTIAKLAARIALHEKRRVELITLDTYRIAAVEQLKTYAEIIGAGYHVVRSVLELDALLRRLPEDTAVLIDTAGRSPHDLADQYELSEYLRHNQSIRKCLTIQATTHPFDAAAALKKFEMYGADCLALTKLDETMYPGTLLEMIAENPLPMAYICNGQRVPEDLQTATAENFISRIFGEKKITPKTSNR